MGSIGNQCKISVNHTSSTRVRELEPDQVSKENLKAMQCSFLKASVFDVNSLSFDYCGNEHDDSFGSSTVGSSDTSGICGCHVSAKLSDKLGSSASGGLDMGTQINICRQQAFLAVCDAEAQPSYINQGEDNEGMRAYAKNIKKCFCALDRQCSDMAMARPKSNFLQRVDDTNSGSGPGPGSEGL
jgi:hypothetical protein